MELTYQGIVFAVSAWWGVGSGTAMTDVKSGDMDQGENRRPKSKERAAWMLLRCQSGDRTFCSNPSSTPRQRRFLSSSLSRACLPEAKFPVWVNIY